MTTVAIVPANDRAATIAATVVALRAVPAIDRVLVVDDGSGDATTEHARRAGAEVLRLSTRVGHGAATLAGVQHTPEADVYLLVDAGSDEGAGAAVAAALLAPVLADEADLAVGVLPRAGGPARTLARFGIRRACGRDLAAPPAGHRAVRADLVRAHDQGDAAGLEIALTIDAVRAGARVIAIEEPAGPSRRRRSFRRSGSRPAQLVDTGRALWPRITTPTQRIAGGAAVFLVVVAGMLWVGSRWVPSSAAAPTRPSKVIVFGMAPMGFADIGKGHTPNLDRLMGQGAIAALSVRTASHHPSLAEGYLSLGGGYRLEAHRDGAEAYDAATRLGRGTAGALLANRTGFRPAGRIVMVGGASVLGLNQSKNITSGPGALGRELAKAGRSAAAVGNGDEPDSVTGQTSIYRPAPLAVMKPELSVDDGTVESQALLRRDPLAPFGVRADPAKVMTALARATRTADVVVVDPGDLSRAEDFAADATDAATQEARDRALERTDALLDRVVRFGGRDTLVLVVSVSPGGDAFKFTPMVAVGAGVRKGYLFSPSTKRAGIVAITDLAPTILHAVGVEAPDTMPGHALRYHPGDSHLSTLRDQDRNTTFRERSYYPWTIGYVTVLVVVYLGAAMAFRRQDPWRRSGSVLRPLVLGGAAFPLATFVYRLIPGAASLGGFAFPVLLAMCAVAAWIAGRSRRTPLSSLNLIMLATVVTIGIDACTGTWLHVGSWLGYSLHNAGRFYGIPNTTFAVLAATGLLIGAGRVQYAPRPREAVLGIVALLALVVLVDGAPSLGGDVGGIVTLVPLFGLAVVGISGRKLTVRSVALVVGVTLLVLGAATVVDILRPAEAQTHLGRFANRVYHDGPGTIWTTISRKQAANLRPLRVSIWKWAIPIQAGFLLYLLVWKRRWSSLLPIGSPLRTGAVAAVAGGLIGFVANDSGPVVIALFFVYLLPYLVLLGIDQQRDSPVLLAPIPPDEPGADDPPAGEAAVAR